MNIMPRLFGLFAFLICWSATAQDEKSLLWKISGNGLTAPSYLFGTAHLLCDAAIDAKTNAAITNTAQLYLEIDMDDPNVNAQMIGLMMMKDNVTMSSLLPKEEYALLDKALQKHVGASLGLFDSTKPMLLTSFFLPTLMDCTPASMEQLIMDAAAAQNHEVLGLETVAEQFEAIDAIPYKEQLEQLIKAVRNDFAEEKAQLNQLFTLYRASDIEGLLKLTAEDPGTKDHDDVLLKDRNKRWVPKIIQAISTKPTFFGVGAAHLAGADGLIVLLREKGYVVTAM